MEEQTKFVKPVYRVALFVFVLTAIAAFFFAIGLLYSKPAVAKEKRGRVVYPKKSKLDFEGTEIEGVINNPGEFYFKHRPQEKFGSLVQRRKNFHREMLRDVVMSK